MGYQYFGVMLDCSRNAVMKVSEVKTMIEYLSKMGYNALELYTEDTYEIEDEPYFGYMRGRYTATELREIDEYAKERNIELIPCIQTLAHFTNLVKLECYQEIVDVNDILLIDEEKTYILIEKMFQTLSANFTSRRVNIGMDEAHFVGLGKYLEKHGYGDRSQLLVKHLNRVLEIATKYGFVPHMWSDMFFRLANNGEYSVNASVKDSKDKITIPKNIELVYWDYYGTEKSNYDKMFYAHKKFNRDIWFAGGAWSWAGFAPLNWFALRTMRPAMESVRENNIKNVLVTMWGDNGKECSFYSLLPSLYAIRRYADGCFDESTIKEEFFKLFQISFDDFLLLDLPNKRPNSDWETTNIRLVPSKIILYSDCFVNSNDAFKEMEENTDYALFAKQLMDAKDRVGDFGYIFQTLSSLCSVLEIKDKISLKTRKAYSLRDIKKLESLIVEYSELEKRIQIFHSNLFNLWSKENKAFGWEIQDARLGGLIQRVKTCKLQIKMFLCGEIDRIEELESPVLPLTKKPFMGRYDYKSLISVSEL